MKIKLLQFLITSNLVVISTLANGNSTPPKGENDQPLTINVDGKGLISLNASNISVDKILETLANRKSMELNLEGQFQKKISLDLKALPLNMILGCVLKDHNVLVYQIQPIYEGKKKEKQLHPAQLWVYSLESNGSLSSFPGKNGGNSSSPATPPPPPTGAPKPPIMGGMPSFSPPPGLPPDVILPEGMEQMMRMQEHVNNLASRGDSSAIQELSFMIEQGGEGVSESAIMALGYIGGPESANALGPALKSNDPSIRELTIDTLGEIGGTEAINMLNLAKQDPDPHLQEIASDYLEELSENPN